MHILVCCYLPDSFIDALFTSLQLEIAEGWNEVMQEAITVSGGPNSSGVCLSRFAAYLSTLVGTILWPFLFMS